MLGFTQNQLSKISDVISNYHLFILFDAVGYDMLTSSEQGILDIMFDDFYPDQISQIEQFFLMGLINESIGDVEFNKLSLRDVRNFVSNDGTRRLIKLSDREKDSINYLKGSSYRHIRNLEVRQTNDLLTVMDQVDQKLRSETENTIREELSRGVAKRKTLNEISRGLASRTGNWAIDWQRIVRTETAKAYNYGIVHQIKRDHGDDAYVYVEVNDQTVCSKCISQYLTKGKGSAPKIFKLNDLIANGNNHGKKSEDYAPVIPPLHPNCYCRLKPIEPGYVWSPLKKIFVPGEKYVRSVSRRSKIKISIGKTHFEI